MAAKKERKKPEPTTGMPAAGRQLGAQEGRREDFSLRSHSPVTILHVSHHLNDAERLADSILLLKEGKIESMDVATLRRQRPTHDPLFPDK